MSFVDFYISYFYLFTKFFIFLMFISKRQLQNYKKQLIHQQSSNFCISTLSKNSRSVLILTFNTKIKLRQTYNNTPESLTNLFVMHFPIFEEDSYFDQIHKSSGWVKDCALVDLIDFEQNDHIKNHTSDQQIQLAYLKALEPFSSLQLGTQSSIEQNFQPNLPIQKPLCRADDNHLKSQKIFQSQKHDKIKTPQNKKLLTNRRLSINLQTKQKSKYNNMGGFLIGTFAQILQSQKRYRFDNGWLQIFMNGDWKFFEKIDFYDTFEVESSLSCLKEKIFNLPRKDGAKKHLFDLINSEDSDSESIKISKSILRKELAHGLSQEYWLLEHVRSRDFKPQNDDFLGTKKKQRHDDYFAYLKAIEYSLNVRGCLPKRIHV